MANCSKCGSPMATSQTGKNYCSALCWLPEEQRKKPQEKTEEVKESKFRSHKEINAEAIFKGAVAMYSKDTNNFTMQKCAEECFLAWAQILEKLN